MTRKTKSKSRGISPNVAACLKAAHLMDDGKVHEAYELIKECRRADLQEAVEIIDMQALWFRKCAEIAERHGVADEVSIRAVLNGAARAGDKEARALIDAGILECMVY